jgi:nucleoside-diphosphate-sugar epimerase
MKILIAGASGAIGQPLIDLLVSHKHDVYGITQSKERAQIITAKGATPLILDILGRESVFSAIEKTRPDIIIDMLTRLPKEYTPESMHQSAEMDAKLRLQGGAHLQAAAEKHGAKRYIAQSSAFWYAPGLGLADEHTPFAFEASPGIASGTRVYAEIEKRVLQSKKIEGVSLRFGFFYGPGTWFHPGGDVANQILKQKFPIIGQGQGVWNFIHIEDAAKAIVSAIQSSPGIYNIVNDQPIEMHHWLPAFANYLSAPPPPTITEEEAIKTRGPDAVYYATKLRGASNTKAKKELNFLPRPLEWITT